ncbi:MAG: anti-sigma factor [Planctomycetes bacterium]|nr:anti-sigma factor [Planctomycetota bacterium]
MSACRAEFEELVDSYSVGTLDGDERAVFERHLLSGCAACRTAVERSEHALAALALAAPPAQPSPAVRESVLRSLPGTSRPARFPRWLAVAAAILFVVGVAGWWLWSERGREIDDLGRTLAKEREQSESLEARTREIASALDAEKKAGAGRVQEAQSLRDELAFISSATTRRIEMTAEPGKGSHVATAFVDLASGHTLVRGVAMPKLSPGRVYQLWYVKQAANPVSGGTFTSSDSTRGYDHQGPDHLKDEVILAITEEPAGGSPGPTTTPFAYGLVAAN